MYSMKVGKYTFLNRGLPFLNVFRGEILMITSSPPDSQLAKTKCMRTATPPAPRSSNTFRSPVHDEASTSLRRSSRDSHG